MIGNRRPLALGMLLGMLMTAGGASCRNLREPLPTGPAVFQQAPSAAEVVEAINANASTIRELQSEGATISVQGLPAVQARLALQRPRSMRLQAVVGFGAADADIGSNNDLFWLWMRQSWNAAQMEKGIYFARHQDFARSAARQLLPIEPEWLIQALGVVTIEGHSVLRGPTRRGDGRLEIETPLRTASAEYIRTLVVHETYAWVMEQHVKDAGGRLIASCRAFRHRYYPEHGVSLPEEVEIDLAPGRREQISLRIYVGRYRINALSNDAESLFAMPRIDGVPQIDLARVRLEPRTEPPPQTSSLDRFRQAPPSNLRGYRRR